MLKDTAHLEWASKPRREINPKDLEFQNAEVVFPNKYSGFHTFPKTPQGDVDTSKMNRLIWGDCQLAMQAMLLQGYEGKINLIYIDPPFDSKADYSHKMKLEGTGEITKKPSIIERLAYKDTWVGGTDSYLDMLYPRLHLMRKLLADNGSIYVHLDWHVGHYVKIIMDEIFGIDKFQREISVSTGWAMGFKVSSNNWIRKHDIILFYSKNPNNFVFNKQFIPYQVDYTKRARKDPDGRLWVDQSLGNLSDEKIEELKRQGRVFRTKTGGLRKKQYLDEMPGEQVGDIWTDILPINSQAKENLNFDTQKPEALLERIIKASSNEGDLVADFFCGSGTTLAVAEKLGRRWIGCDLSKVAIQVTRSRLVDMDVKPFVIENIGNYQREMIYLQGGRIDEMQRIIMKLYGSHQHPTHRDLGVRITDEGIKALVYVGYPDRHVTAKKAVEIARLAESLDGRGYKKVIILAWDYEYNFDANFSEGARNLQVEVEPRVIPSDIYEYLKTSKTEDDLYEKVVFHQKPYFKLSKPSARPYGNGKNEVTIGIERYVLSDLPLAKEKDIAELNKLMKDNFAILIDYWAVDWDFDGHTFRSRWQDFRGNGRNAKTVTTKSKFILEAGKHYEIAVRVVDVFGNDASATVKVNLGGE